MHILNGYIIIFLVILLSTPVEIVVFKILNHAMVLALEIEFFAMVDVINQKTAGKNIFSSNNYIKAIV